MTDPVQGLEGERFPYQPLPEGGIRILVLLPPAIKERPTDDNPR
jgi:hypothetical protein